MSAINGIFHWNGAPVPVENGIRMMKALEIYPADNSGVWHQGPVFLGCHAQWITPESVGEMLPRYDGTRGLAITADAMIDNRGELFDQLQVEPARRNDMPDSALILLAYERWGADCPNHLAGDFAFLIWDERNRRLFGARDFSGSRTLYFHRNPQGIAFCTTIQPLLSLPYVEQKLNEQWMAEFLAHPGMVDTVEAASTVYQGIEQVPPSHSITVTEGKIAVCRYCTIPTGVQLKFKKNEDYVEAFRAVFQDAVTARLRTHRHVGAYLSGGLDSGAVAGFAARALDRENKPLYTYSYIPTSDFQDWTPKYRMADERPYIQSTVQHVGNIKDHYLDFDGRSPLTEVDDWLETLEMPYKFFENSFWIKGIYEKASEQGVGILLNGARGNFTISWGPALDYYASLLKKLKWLRLHRELQQYSKNQGVGRSRILSAIGGKAFPLLERMRRTDKREPFPSLIHPDLAKKTGVFKKLQDKGVNLSGISGSSVNLYELRKQMFEQFYAWNMNGNTTTKLSLRYALWNRDPTNDIRVIRYCLSLPEEQFVQNGLDRALIRRSTENLLPDEVRLNQRTRGIQGADVMHRMLPSWKAVVEEVRQLCNDPDVSGLLNISVIEDALSHFRDTPRPEDSYHMKIKVLMRSLIFYRFIKKMA